MKYTYILTILTLLISSCTKRDYGVELIYKYNNKSSKKIEIVNRDGHNIFSIETNEFVVIKKDAESSNSKANIKDYSYPLGHDLLGGSIVFDGKIIELGNNYVSDKNSPLNKDAYKKETLGARKFYFEFTFTDEIIESITKK